jgi:hypothetical protein
MAQQDNIFYVLGIKFCHGKQFIGEEEIVKYCAGTAPAQY